MGRGNAKGRTQSRQFSGSVASGRMQVQVLEQLRGIRGSARQGPANSPFTFLNVNG